MDGCPSYRHLAYCTTELSTLVPVTMGTPTPFAAAGFDEGDKLSGRGYAEIVDGKLHDYLHIHLGDDSGFRAVTQ